MLKITHRNALSSQMTHILRDAFQKTTFIIQSILIK